MATIRLDKKLGLKMMGGNEELYHKFLEDFAISHENKSLELNWLVENDQIAFKREIHTIKGQAGNVGALILHRLAQKLEANISEQNLKEFCEELTWVCKEFHPGTVEKTEKVLNLKLRHVVSPEKIDALFNDTENALCSGKPLLAQQAIMQLFELNLSEKDHKLLEEVSELVGKYQMKSAYHVIQIRKSNFY